MISTEKRSPATSLTVSETPSSVTEPLGRKKRRKLRRCAQGEPRHVGQFVPRDKLGKPVDMAAGPCGAELVAKPEGAFEIERVPRCQVPAVVTRSVSAGRIDRK